MLELDLIGVRGSFRLEVRCRMTRRVTGLFGRSGAGKSTLLHLVAGLLRPERGRVILDDRVLEDTDAGVRVPAHRRNVGVVFQDARLLPHRSVRGNLLYGRSRAARGGGSIDASAVIDLLELGHLLRRSPRELSGGEAQRVAVGRALLSGPRLLLLDEPLTGLDVGLRRQVLPLLRRVCDELDVPIVYVSHHLEELLQLTDELVVLEAGRIVGSGRYVELAMAGRAEMAPGLTNVVRLVRDASGALAIANGAAPGQAVHVLDADRERTETLVAIRPEDIALARGAVPATSIRNQLRARVTRRTEHAGGILVEMDVGQPLLVQITVEAARELDVRPGTELWCLVKSTAIRTL